MSTFWDSITPSVPWKAPRVGHATVAIGNNILLIGSERTPEEDDKEAKLYSLNLETQNWIRITPGGEKLPNLASHTATLIENTNKVFCFIISLNSKRCILLVVKILLLKFVQFMFLQLVKFFHHFSIYFH